MLWKIEKLDGINHKMLVVKAKQVWLGQKLEWKMNWDVHTTLAMVHTYPDGDRDFSFYRSPGADMMLREDELDEKALESGVDRRGRLLWGKDRQ